MSRFGFAVEGLLNGEVAKSGVTTFTTERERGFELVVFGHRLIFSLARNKGDDGTDNEKPSKHRV